MMKKVEWRLKRFQREIGKFYFACKRNPSLDQIPSSVIKTGYNLITIAQRLFPRKDLVELELLNARMMLVKRPYDMCVEFEQYLSKMGDLVQEINGTLNPSNTDHQCTWARSS